MDSTINGIIIGAIGSLVATGIISWSKKRKIKAIRQRIADLELEENFLNRISKGNIELLRSSFITLFLIIGILGVSTGTVIIAHANNFPAIVSKIIINFGGALALGAGLGAISYSRSIRKLRNLPEERTRLQNKRNKLEEKIKKA